LIQFSVELSHVELKIWATWLELSWKCEQFNSISVRVQNVNLKLNLIISLRIYYFSKMRKQIKNIIRKCNVYIHTKHNQHKLYELLKSFSTSDHVWKSIALNFIVKLFKLKKRVIKTVRIVFKWYNQWRSELIVLNL